MPVYPPGQNSYIINSQNGEFCNVTAKLIFLSPLISLLIFISFGRGMKGPRAGSRQRQHSTAVRMTVIIYTIMTKQETQQLTQTRDRHRNKSAVFLQTVQTESKLPLCVSSSLLGTQRDFHVSALCVEDPSPPPSAPTIDATDATHRRHHSTAPPSPIIRFT